MKKMEFPNYKQIYKDIIAKKHPEKEKECQPILGKEQLSSLDIIELNELIFGKGNKDTGVFNQKHRSYDISTILTILEFQKINNYNNSQLANYYSLSRNTIVKWRKLFSV